MKKLTLFLKKTWIWIKNYWYIPASAIVVLVSYFVFHQRNIRLEELLKVTRVSYEEELKDLQKVQEKRESERRDIEMAHSERREEIEKEHIEEKEASTAAADKRNKKRINKYKNDPKKLADELNKSFGINR